MKCVECGQWSDSPKPHRDTCKAQYLPAPAEVQAQAAQSEIPDLQRVLECAAKAGQRMERFPGGIALVGAPPVWQERCGEAPPTFRYGPAPRDGKWHVVSNAPSIKAETWGERDLAQPHTPGTYREKIDRVVHEIGTAPPVYGNFPQFPRAAVRINAPAPVSEPTSEVEGHVQSTHRVCWRTPAGDVGRGNPVSEAKARALAAACNRRYPEMPHWVETA